MFGLKCITFIIVVFIVFINANDNGLSDIPFNGTPDDVEDAFRTKMAVELAEKGKIPLLNKKTLAAVTAASGGVSGGGTGLDAAVNSRPTEMNAALGGSFIDGMDISSSGKTGGSNTYSSTYHAGK